MSANLSQEQKNAVAGWVAEGNSLSGIQKRINAEFGISMTYMDVRFLVDDLDLVLKDKAPAAPENTNTTDAGSTNNSAGDDAVSFGGDEYTAAAPAPGQQVSVSIDPVQRPGVAAGGSVTFSDGKTGQWQVDAYGQLGFIPPYDGYQPSPQDVQQFRAALQRELAKGGF